MAAGLSGPHGVALLAAAPEGVPGCCSTLGLLRLRQGSTTLCPVLSCTEQAQSCTEQAQSCTEQAQSCSAAQASCSVAQEAVLHALPSSPPDRRYGPRPIFKSAAAAPHLRCLSASCRGSSGSISSRPRSSWAVPSSSSGAHVLPSHTCGAAHRACAAAGGAAGGQACMHVSGADDTACACACCVGGRSSIWHYRVAVPAVRSSSRACRRCCGSCGIW